MQIQCLNQNLSFLGGIVHFWAFVRVINDYKTVLKSKVKDGTSLNWNIVEFKEKVLNLLQWRNNNNDCEMGGSRPVVSIPQLTAEQLAMDL